jgi:hypothetical protein
MCVAPAFGADLTEPFVYTWGRRSDKQCWSEPDVIFSAEGYRQSAGTLYQITERGPCTGTCPYGVNIQANLASAHSLLKLG